MHLISIDWLSSLNVLVKKNTSKVKLVLKLEMQVCCLLNVLFWSPMDVLVGLLVKESLCVSYSHGEKKVFTRFFAVLWKTENDSWFHNKRFFFAWFYWSLTPHCFPALLYSVASVRWALHAFIFIELHISVRLRSELWSIHWNTLILFFVSHILDVLLCYVSVAWPSFSSCL